MKQKRWYKRLFVSYFPILIITVVIISIVFAIAYENAVIETEKSNRNFTGNTVGSMENSLKNIELMLVDQIVKNEAIHDFFTGNANETNYINYKASSEISKIAKSNPLIYSIYIYRFQDQAILTGEYVENLDDFSDKQFVRDIEKKPQSLRWSSVRSYTELPMINPADRVISISKNAMGNQGIVVLNVKINLLLSTIKKLKDNDHTFMDINDIQGNPVFSTNSGHLQANAMIQMDSDYMGMRFMSGMTDRNLFGQAIKRTSTPIIVILIFLLIIIVYIMYITRKNYENYEPIEKILRQQEAEKVLPRQFFLELQEDAKSISLTEWKSYASLFGLRNGRKQLFIAVIEIDKYAPCLQRDRQETISSKEQLSDAVRHWTDPQAKALCADWISGDRMGVLVQVLPERQTDAGATHGMMDKLREWTERELCFSVTIGIGSTAVDISDMAISFREALAALQYKMAVGSNRIIAYSHFKDKEIRIHSQYFKWMEDFILHFRMATPKWEPIFAQIFDHLEESVLKNDEMQQLLNYWVHRCAREMEELMPEIQKFWNDVTLSPMTDVLQESASIKEIRDLFLSLFRQLYEQYVTILADKHQRKFIYEIKAYIEDNYANPDLSLNHISERFGINGKYASQLFKEEFGVKFLDFLIGLRMEHAKKMLLETGKSIHEISLNVGYVHAISFGRIFKKISGVSPGDYRKQMLMQ
jgi:two-component system response regulator YesN